MTSRFCAGVAVLIVLCFDGMLTLTGTVEASDPLYPTKDLARFVVDRLDVRSFPTSIGARRDDRRVFFRDYGIVAHRITENEADLKKSDDSWYFVITILKKTDSGILVCFEDRGEYPAHYYTESVLLLTRPDTKSVLTGARSNTAVKECPVSEQ
jgi:hypothetical protein